MKIDKGFILMSAIFLFAIIFTSFASASLTDGRVGYWKLDEDSGNAIDEQGIFNLTRHGTITNAEGISGNAKQTSHSMGNRYLGTPTTYNANDNTICIWLKGDTNNTDFDFYGTRVPSAGMWMYYTSGMIQYGVADDMYGSTSTLYPWAFDTNWNFICQVFGRGGNNIELWWNGINVDNGTWDGRTLAGANLSLFSGVQGKSGGSFILDEVMIWNRTLIGTEIIELNETIPSAKYTVTLNSPSNNSVISTSTQAFNTSMTITEEATNWNWTNATTYLWFSNGTLFNYTVKGGLTGNTTSAEINISGLVLGNYLWNTYACYSNATYGNCSWASINYTLTYDFQLGLCNATLTVPYLNFTFKDESTNNRMNATIPTSTFVYYLDNPLINKTLTYTQTVNKSNYMFCASQSNKTYYIDSYIQYKMGTDYPQRIYDPDVTAYTNTTNNITLYLLSSTDGIYVTFQVINSADQLVSGVQVIGTREIGGVVTTVASGTTDSAGSITFWLNPDFSQDFSFSKTGYTTYTTSLTPTQSAYTITLSGGGSTTTKDYLRGIKNYIYPSINELDNDTEYNFIFNVTSSYWELDSFGFNLRLANGTIVGTDSSTTEGVGAFYLYNVNNQTIIYMDYYWTIEGNQTTGSKYFIITNTLYTDWSIKTFFTDFKLYINTGDGLFGLDDFGRILISFLVLFLVVGVMGYKYGMNNPVFISVLTFSVVFFLDVTTGLIPTIRGIPHLITYLAGLICFLVVISEGSR